MAKEGASVQKDLEKDAKERLLSRDVGSTEDDATVGPNTEQNASPISPISVTPNQLEIST
jgi:hypothetical protein